MLSSTVNNDWHTHQHTHRIKSWIIVQIIKTHSVRHNIIVKSIMASCWHPCCVLQSEFIHTHTHTYIFHPQNIDSSIKLVVIVWSTPYGSHPWWHTYKHTHTKAHTYMSMVVMTAPEACDCTCVCVCVYLELTNLTFKLVNIYFFWKKYSKLLFYLEKKH